MTDPRQNPNWPVDIAEAQRAIAVALLDELPLDAHGRRRWENTDAYTRAHLATNAAQAGMLDQLLEDPGFLLAGHPAALLDVLREARSLPARCAAAV